MLAESTKKHYIILLSSALIFVVFMSTEAQADMYKPWWEWGIVENNSGLYSTYASQLSINVTPYGSMVDFTFTNATGGSQAAITGIYIEDGTLLGLASVIALDADADDPSRDGIIFGSPAHPSNMPGWSTLNPKFYASSAFSVGSNGAPDGVSPGESVVLRYGIQSGFDFDDVIAALNLGITNPDPSIPRDSIRIGLHIQDLGQESDTLILTPIPASVVLGILGMGVVGLKLRKYA